MKEFWVEIDDLLPDKIRNTLLNQLKNICSVALIGKNSIKMAKAQGLKIASEFGDEIHVMKDINLDNLMNAKKDGKIVCLRLTVKNKDDEVKIEEAATYGADYIITSLPGWKIIPLENLIARIKGKTKLLTEVTSVEEAKLAMEILEFGVDGVVFKTDDAEYAMKMASILKKLETPKLKMSYAKILRIKQLGLGDRVCVDTVELMTAGEGILTGCQSSGLFLVQAEVTENPHVESRPFRVNAGPVPQYILTSQEKTRYLSELRTGDEILILDRDGNVRKSTIGRVKIEKRPLVMVEAEADKKQIKTILQNAETIHLVTRDGSKSINDLQSGDEVAVYLQPGGRHFGILVEEESVIER